MSKVYEDHEVEAARCKSFKAGWALGFRDGEDEAQSKIADLIETYSVTARSEAHHVAATWLSTLAVTIRRGEWR